MRKTGWLIAKALVTTYAVVLCILIILGGTVPLTTYSATLYIISCILLVIYLGKVMFSNTNITNKTIQLDHKPMVRAVNDADNNSIYERSLSGIAKLDINGRIRVYNKSFQNILGIDESEYINKYYYDLLDKSASKNIQSAIQSILDGSKKEYQENIQCLKKNGDWKWVTVHLSLVGDRISPDYILMQMHNYMFEHELESKLKEMAYHDPLTGYDNRHKFELSVKHILASCRRTNEQLGFLYVDIDKLKSINDTKGHDVGDKLIQAVVKRIKSKLRNEDIAARIGGDEFVIVIRDAKSVESLAAVAVKLLKAVNQPIKINKNELRVTMSIGISMYPFDGHELSELLKHADMALYKAKENYGDNYQFYTAEMTSKAKRHFELKAAIDSGLKNNEFEVYYQPQINIETAQIIGIEAFIRWKNPTYNAISREEIISLAEESGSIMDLSFWVIEESAREMKKWKQMGLQNLYISINLSSKPFHRPGFVDKMLSIFHDHGLSPKQFMVELTESTIMEHAKDLTKSLYLLKDAGFQVAIDNFGTGYWSLSNMRHLKVDLIKIDRHFINQIDYDHASRDIVAAIIAMSHKLGIRCMAEGVETRSQYSILKEEACDDVQGYYFSKPLPADKMAHFLKHPVSSADSITN